MSCHDSENSKLGSASLNFFHHSQFREFIFGQFQTDNFFSAPSQNFAQAPTRLNIMGNYSSISQVITVTQKSEDNDFFIEIHLGEVEWYSIERVLGFEDRKNNGFLVEA